VEIEKAYFVIVGISFILALMKKKTYLILHNIRSAYNVGSLFRTADGAGVSKIFLTGHTPTPTDHFGRKRKDLAKVALGAEESVVWEKRDDIFKLIEELQKQNFEIVAVEQSPQAIANTEHIRKQKCAYILGNEVDGLSNDVLGGF
jgi:tRNA G18 (ribose-2'-O)-methylase SpoU